MPRPSFLPDQFGNLGLPGWEELVVPDPVSLRPQTVGWWVLAALALAALAWWLAHAAGQYRRNRYRREAAAELDSIRHEPASARSLAKLPPLLKRTALCAYPRKEVAALSGPEWAQFLARSCPSAGFDAELGAALATVSYRGAESVSPDTAARLVEASHAWIRGHDAHL